MAVERTELHLRAILDSALDCIVSMDHHGAIVEFNRAAEEQFGYSRAEALGRDAGELIVPLKHREGHHLGLERFMMTGETHIIGERIRTTAMRADGSEFACELSVTLSTAMAQPIFTAYIRDVTEQEYAEEALQQNQRTLATLMSNLPGMAYRCPENEYWNMAYVSEGCRELTGYDPEDLQSESGLSFEDLIYTEDRERARELVQQALERREAFQVHYRIRTKEGQEKWANERGRGVFSVFSTTGEIIAVEGFITDITERRRAEELLSQYSERLKTEVAERTLQLNTRNKELKSTLAELRKTHDQLIMQEKLASLGALTAGIAHEIKNPLNFVNNFAQLSNDLTEELRELLPEMESKLDEATVAEVKEIVSHLSTNSTKIQEHGKRADSIMRSMLLMSRGTSGERQATDLNALLEEDLNLAYHGMRAQDKTFNVTFERAFDENVGEVEIVPEDVGRVFLNIVNNACHAVHARQKRGEEGYVPVIRVSTRMVGEMAEIRVWDNGPGIPPDVQDKVFNPFFTTKPAGQGTGLGLSIAYETIVQKHGGRLEVDSAENEFTEFLIAVPKRVSREST